MANRPTLQDVAREAGLGVATVDRALHGRGNVSVRARAKVAEAAARLGYHAPGLAMPGADRLSLRFGFVLHKAAQDFYRDFAHRIEAACAAHPGATITPQIHFSPSQAPDDFAAAFAAASDGAHAVAGSAVNHPVVDRQVEALTRTGLPVFALLNDFGRGMRTGYFGLDNMRVGRIAGWMLGTLVTAPGKVAIFVGGNRWHGHVLRETGFRSYLRENAPGLRVLDTLVNLETRRVTYEATLELLDSHPDLRGLYVAGGGMEGAIEALREMRPPGKVALAVNEQTPESLAALSDGYATLVIATPLEALCRALVEAMLAASHGTPLPGPEARFLQPQLFLPESV